MKQMKVVREAQYAWIARGRQLSDIILDEDELNRVTLIVDQSGSIDLGDLKVGLKRVDQALSGSGAVVDVIVFGYTAVYNFFGEFSLSKVYATIDRYNADLKRGGAGGATDLNTALKILRSKIDQTDVILLVSDDPKWLPPGDLSRLHTTAGLLNAYAYILDITKDEVAQVG